MDAGPMLGIGAIEVPPMAVGEGYEVFIGPEYLDCSEPWGESGRPKASWEGRICC